ncbi:hypothetical protein WMF18_01735 [Sorangium sp. So ce315]|uniref:hypothetical protein n=1 Tax=Sorangium sp. So ce315 TaxID=3133299 RepID=UPI003F619599
MSRAAALAYLLQAITVALAVALWSRRREHRPFTMWAGGVLAADLARRAIMLSCPWIALPGPHTGLHRAIFHVDQALFFTDSAGLAAIALVVFTGRRPWVPLAVGGVTWAALTIGYPWPFRGQLLGSVYALAYAAAVVTSIVAMVVWTRRRERPRIEHAAVSLSTLIVLTLFAGPFAPPCPAPFETWSVAELTFAMLWAAMALLHAAALWGGFGFEPAGRPARPR